MSIKTRRARIAFLLSCTTIMALHAGAAQAADTAAPAAGQDDDSAPASAAQAAEEAAESTDTGLGDIVVTAQRRSENLQRVPIAVAVATAEQLEASGVTTLQNLKLVTPGLEVQSNNGYAFPILRGVGSKAAGAGIESPVAVYLDDVYYAAPTSTLLTFNNISQVEVLKGPQGTLFGRNATGGLLNVTTRDPTQEISGDFSVSYGSYDTWKGNAYLAGGLSDNLAMDLAFTGTTMGRGYGVNLLNGDDVYRVRHDIGLRSKLLFTPGSSTEVRLILDFQDARHNLTTTRLIAGETAPAPLGPSYGGGSWDTSQSVTPNLDFQGGGASLKIDQDLGAVRFASITAYRESSYHIFYDFDYTPTNGRIADVRQDDTQFSQEFRLLSANDSPLTWVIGAYYLKASGKYPFVNVYFNGPSAVGNPATILQSTVSRQDTDSIAGFGQATLEVTADLRVTAGIRYTSEKRSLIDATTVNTRSDGSQLVSVPLTNKSTRFNKPTWRLAVDYSLTPDVMAYLSYNRGFKSGGYNPSGLTLPPFEPENLDAYEAGLKTTLFDRHVRFNLAGYYYDYTNVQLNRTVGNASGIYNGGAARIYGLDAELQARVAEGFDLKFGYQYANGKYTAFPGALISSPRPAGGYTLVVGDATGNRTILTPRSTFSAQANYQVPLGDNKVSFNGTYYYNSGYAQDPDNYIQQASYSLVNASVRFETAQGMWFSLWGNNLTNALVANVDGIQSVGTGVGLHRASYAAPRTYGIMAGIRF